MEKGLETKNNNEEEILNKLVNKLEELKEHIERLKEEINKLEQEIRQTKYKDDINYIFDKLQEVTNDKLNTVIFVDNGNVKYITRHQDSGFGVLIINNGKGYLLESFKLKENLEIAYFEEYNIPNEIISLLKTVQESDIYRANAILFQLYYLLQKYPANFVKVKYD